MTYDPSAYWKEAGADPDNPEHESHFVRTPVFARQEERLMSVLEGLEFATILEVGCGWGRITKLVHDRWPDVRYTAIDLSAERIASAQEKAPEVRFKQSTLADYPLVLFGKPRRFDLVLAVEVLMHVLPDEIEETVAKLVSLSSRYVVSLDWSADLGDTPIAPWNFRQDYAALYGKRLRSVEQTDLQAIYVAEVPA